LVLRYNRFDPRLRRRRDSASFVNHPVHRPNRNSGKIGYLVNRHTAFQPRCFSFISSINHKHVYPFCQILNSLNGKDVPAVPFAGFKYVGADLKGYDTKRADLKTLPSAIFYHGSGDVSKEKNVQLEGNPSALDFAYEAQAERSCVTGGARTSLLKKTHRVLYLYQA
jgi:hypothetical protein